MGEVAGNNPEKQSGNLSVKDLINASLKGEKDLQKRILEKYESKGLKAEAKEELAKVLNVFRREIKELNNTSNLEHKDIKNKTKTDLSSLKAEVENDNKKELGVDELEKKLKQNYEIVDRLDELNDDLSDFDKVKTKLSNLDNYDEFTQMISSLNDEKLEDKTYGLLAQLVGNRRNLRKIKRLKLPISQDKLQDFLSKLENKNLTEDLLYDFDKIKILKIDGLESIGETEYTINKVNELLNTKGFSPEEIKILEDKKVDFQTKKEYLEKQKLKNINNDLNNLDKKKTDLQEKKTDLQEKKTDLQEKKTDLQEKKTDLQYINEQKDKRINKLRNIAKNLDKKTIDNFLNIKGLDSFLKMKFGELKKLIENGGTIEDKEGKINDIISHLEKPDNLHNFYRQAQESGKAKEAYNLLKDLATVSPGILQLMSTIELPNSPKEFSKENIADGILGVEGAKLNGEGEYFGENGEKIKIDGDVAELSNFSKTGYELETGKIDLKDIKGDIKELKEKYKELNDIAGDYYKLRELKLQIAKLGDDKEAIQDLLNKNGFNDIQDLNQNLEQKKEEYEENKKTFLEKKEDIKEVFKNKKEKLKEKNEKQKNTLKFLSKIGFDLVPQFISTQLIENINLNPTLYGFDTKISLENGDLGLRGFGDDYLGAEYKERFTRLFIKAIGNPEGEYELKTDNVNNNSSVIDSSKLNIYLNTNGYKGFGAFTKMKENLKKSKQEKQK